MSTTRVDKDVDEAAEALTKLRAAPSPSNQSGPVSIQSKGPSRDKTEHTGKEHQTTGFVLWRFAYILILPLQKAADVCL